MRVAEHVEQEQRFSEGEPELEAPEELAVGELDDDTMLEEDLDSELVLEEDVDVDVLEETLEDLVHVADDDEDGDVDGAGGVGGPVGVQADDDPEELDLEPLDVADVEESLDRILRARMAIEELQADGEEGDGEAAPGAAAAAVLDLTMIDVVRPCGSEEFVCRGCFLVRHRVQLADGMAMLCRDCAV